MAELPPTLPSQIPDLIELNNLLWIRAHNRLADLPVRLRPLITPYASLLSEKKYSSQLSNFNINSILRDLNHPQDRCDSSEYHPLLIPCLDINAAIRKKFVTAAGLGENYMQILRKYLWIFCNKYTSTLAIENIDYLLTSNIGRLPSSLPSPSLPTPSSSLSSLTFPPSIQAPTIPASQYPPLPKEYSSLPLPSVGLPVTYEPMNAEIIRKEVRKEIMGPPPPRPPASSSSSTYSSSFPSLPPTRSPSLPPPAQLLKVISTIRKLPHRKRLSSTFIQKWHPTINNSKDN